MEKIPLGLKAWQVATRGFSPAAPLILRERAARGKEDMSRIGERLGHASVARPSGNLIWLHGASVGESLSALPLIERLMANGMAVLVTSGTVTSARMMQNLLPCGALHQFVPIDTPMATERFFDYWRPQAGLFIESDLWPNLILSARARGIPLALVNARISERSFRGWQRAPKTVSALLSCFSVCLAQDEDIAARFCALGARDVRVAGSLKADALPLGADEGELQKLRGMIGSRPVLLGAQTHPGEDETLLPAHDALRALFSDLLTILVPRHPERGAEIAMLSGNRGVARRANGMPIAAETQVYVADTLGELGLFYRLAPFCFVGGTLVPMGGHNPLEPARLCCGILAGPHTASSASAYDAILREQGMGTVASAADITAIAGMLLSDRGKSELMGQAAARGAAMLSGAVDKTVAAVETLLGHARA